MKFLNVKIKSWFWCVFLSNLCLKLQDFLKKSFKSYTKFFFKKISNTKLFKIKFFNVIFYNKNYGIAISFFKIFYLTHIYFERCIKIRWNTSHRKQGGCRVTMYINILVFFWCIILISVVIRVIFSESINSNIITWFYIYLWSFFTN